MKRSLLFLLVAIMVLSIVGCQSSAVTEAVVPDDDGSSEVSGEETSGEEVVADSSDRILREQLVVAISQEPPTLDAYAASNEVVFLATQTVFESLIKNVDGELVPWLATGFDIIDDTTIRFTLREDVLFHDGTPMTAEDVLFSMSIAQTSNFTSTIFGALDIENSQVIDDFTVEFKLQYPFAPIMEAFACYRGAIFSKAAYESMGAEAFGRAPVGTGPMMFSGWVAGDRIELVKNDSYWGVEPAYGKLVFRVILEASSRAIELETGGVDIAFDLSTTDWGRIDEDPSLQMLKGTSLKMVYLCFNNENELYGNELIRKAIAYAINVEAVATTAYQGYAEAADGFMAKSIPGYKVEGPWEYNPEKSKELLAEAGYEDGLEVKFITFQQQNYNAAIEIIQSMLKEVGITATIEMVDITTFTTMNNAGELPMTVMSNSATILDPASALVAWPLARTISLRHNDQHVQDLLDAGEQTYAMEDRIPIYEELQDYLWDKLYLLPLAYPERGYAASGTILNFEFVSTGIPDFTVIEFTQE
ncbi:ABC transporter substrate-binding protein [Chloroflexota bacterium]|nr:ABC transporter substrate-binding protein [Chloroflexota bacterium]